MLKVGISSISLVSLRMKLFFAWFYPMLIFPRAEVERSEDDMIFMMSISKFLHKSLT